MQQKIKIISFHIQRNTNTEVVCQNEDLFTSFTSFVQVFR